MFKRCFFAGSAKLDLRFLRLRIASSVAAADKGEAQLLCANTDCARVTVAETVAVCSAATLAVPREGLSGGGVS